LTLLATATAALLAVPWHRSDIDQTLSIYRFLPFNDGGATVPIPRVAKEYLPSSFCPRAFTQESAAMRSEWWTL